MLGRCSFIQGLGVAGGSGAGVCLEPSIDWTTVVLKTAGGDVANLARSLFLFLGRCFLTCVIRIHFQNCEYQIRRRVVYSFIHSTTIFSSG